MNRGITNPISPAIQAISGLKRGVGFAVVGEVAEVVH
jgi:hypothetical protein